MNDETTRSMAAITEWLLGSEARNLPNAAAILKALCPRLSAAGLPLGNQACHVPWRSPSR